MKPIVTVVGGLQSPLPPVPVLQPGDHAYFDSLRQSPQLLRAFSLRDPAQLTWPNQGGFAHSNARALVVTYDPANDPDPRKQDAAKIVINTSSNSLTNQVHLPIPAYAGSLFVTWDAWYGREFAYSVHGITNHKEWQFASPTDRIWTEVRSRFNLASVGKIAKVDVRYYGTQFGPGTMWGPADSIAPQSAQFDIAPETWTRYWALFTPATAPFYEFSLWMADVNRDPVRLLDKRLITPGSSGRWEQFWIEFNTSTDLVKAGRPDLIAYTRNVIMLQGISDPVPFLIRP